MKRIRLKHYNDDALADDLLWGAAAIADHIRRDIRQTYYLIAARKIPAKKLGARVIVARKSELDRALTTGGGDDC
jgi:hypothetical protein